MASRLFVWDVSASLDCGYDRADGQDWGAELRGSRRSPRFWADCECRTCLVKPMGHKWSIDLRKWSQPNMRFCFKNRIRDSLMSWASWGFAKLNWTREFLLTFHFTLTFCFTHVLVEFVTMCKSPLRQTKSSSTSTDHTVQSTFVLWTKSMGQSQLPGPSCPPPTCDSKAVLWDR